MLISQAAREAYVNREFESFLWLKRLQKEQILRELRQLRVRPRFKTDPWLHQLVCFWIGLCHPRFLFLLDMGAGKALPNTEKVMTPTGYRRMGDLVVGDLVVGADGRPTQITGVFPQGMKEVFSVEFSDHVRVECCDDHLWNVKTPKATSYKTLPLKEFRNHLRWAPSGTKSTAGNRRVFIPMAEPVRFEVQPEPELDPYVLGALLGDGSLSGTNCSLTSADPQLVTMVEMRIPDGISMVLSSITNGCETWSFKGRGGWLRQHLRKLEVNTTSHFKKIPSSYLTGSVESRKLLLAGLLDTDGCVTKQGGFEFASVSEDLADGVLFLVQSLGGAATKIVSTNKFGPVYRISGRTPHNPFKLHRKKSKYSLRLPPYRSVESVTSVGVKECTCITVANPEGLFLANGCVVTHNSKILLDLITQALREKKLTGQALISVPRLINMGSWEEDVLRHSNLEPILCCETNINDKWEQLMDAGGDLSIIDYQGLCLAVTDKKNNQLHHNDKKLKHLRAKYKFIGIDESHKLGNHESLWHSIMWHISKEADFVYATTGTLFGKDPEPVWSQFYLVDKGETFGQNLGLFRTTFYQEFAGPWRKTREFRREQVPLLNTMIQNRAIRYGEREFSDVPKEVMVPINLRMSPEQREHYLRALEGLINAGGKIQETDSAYIRMRQICAGFVAWGDEHGKHVVPIAENPKLLALERILDESDGEKLVISTEFTASGQLISDFLTKQKIKHVWLYGKSKRNPLDLRREFIDDPDCRIFLMQSESGGTGVDGLQKVAKRLVFYESPPSPTTRRQVLKRLVRPGQTEHTFIYDLTMKGSTDVTILEDALAGIDFHERVVDGSAGHRLKELFRSI